MSIEKLAAILLVATFNIPLTIMLLVDFYAQRD